MYNEMVIKLEFIENIDNGLKLKFNKSFKQIKFMKLESCQTLDFQELDFERNEIKYSKEKDFILLFTQEISKFVIIVIEEIDRKQCYYSHYIQIKNNNQSDTIKNENADSIDSMKDITSELLAKGMSLILNKTSGQGTLNIDHVSGQGTLAEPKLAFGKGTLNVDHVSGLGHVGGQGSGLKVKNINKIHCPIKNENIFAEVLKKL